MQIKDLFLKPIDRRINGVIKVGQNTEEDKKQELEEYVVTGELKKHFQQFFTNYDKSLDTPVDEMGVWISGFFGSGKSHFLKILSYILDEPEVAGKKAMDYLIAKDAVKSDPTLVRNMQRAAEAPTLTVLFNVDSKSTSTAKSDSNAIVTVFNRVFNERLGYEGSIPMLAELERSLDEEGKYQLFKDTYQQMNGVSWVEDRRKFRVHRGWVEKALVAMGYMTEEDARNWSKEASTRNAQLSISDFAGQVKRYIYRTHKRVVFLVDEIGQFISTDSHLMLNLQTLTEELGIQCQGKAWVIVTAQEAIDDMTANIGNAQERKNDFSKIQGRFHTRLSLSSVNADEVIRERILKKNATGEASLQALYATEETTIQNAVDFRNTPHEMKKYKNAADFAAVYPFLPYQFNLLADIFTSIRQNSASGRSLSTGERSILGAFQQAAIGVMDQPEGTLVPLYRFYDNIDQVIDHTHKIVIERALQNPELNPNQNPECFDVNVLKVLFLLKYVDGVSLTVNNIMNFMVTQIHEDKEALRRKVSEALERLVKNLYVAQKQDTYTFLTDDEQDMDRAIKSRNVPMADVITNLGSLVFNAILPESRFKIKKGSSGQYTFGINRFIDNRPVFTNQNNTLGLRVLTPYYDGENGTDPLTLSMLSGKNHEVLFVLPVSRVDYYKEMQQALQIEDYLRHVSDPQQGKSTMLRGVKQTEATQRKNAAEKELKEALGQAEIYVNGSLVSTINSQDPGTRYQEAMALLLENVYFHLKDITKPIEEQDIKDLFKQPAQGTVLFSNDPAQEPNWLALAEVKNKVEDCTRVFETISLKNLLDTFTAPPYGYSEKDVQWLAGKLFLKGELEATLNKEPFSRFNTNRDELLNDFTGKRTVDKVLLSAKTKIDPLKLNEAKDLIREFFGHTVSFDDPDQLLQKFQEDAGDKLQEFSRHYDRLYLLHPDFPGKKLVEEAKKQWTYFSSLNHTGRFFDEIHDRYDELMDLAEDLQPVINFLKNENLQNIFQEKGLDIWKLYQGNKDFLMEQPLLQGLADQIRDIIFSKSPYHRIKDLPGLADSFRDGYVKVLEAKGKEVEQAIQLNQQDVEKLLDGKPYAANYSKEVERVFRSLLDQASHENNLAQLLQLKERSTYRYQYFVKQFDKEEKEIARRAAVKKVDQGKPGQPVAPKPVPAPAKRIRHLFLSQVDPRSEIILRTKADIDTLVEQLRSRLEKELQDTDEIILRK